MKKTKEIDGYRVFLPLLFIVFAIIFEIVNFLYLGFTDSNGNLMVVPTYFLFDIGIMIIFAGIIYIVTNKIAMNVVFYFLLSMQFILNVVNSTLYAIFGDILSFDSLFLGAEATSALTVELIDWIGVLINVLLFAAMITLTILFQKKCKLVIKQHKYSRTAFILASFLLFQVVGFGLYGLEKASLKPAVSADSEIETSDEYLYEHFQFKLDAFKKFGHYGFYTKSFLNYIFDEPVDEQKYADFIDDGYIAGDNLAPLYGDNLVVILCESLDWFAIDPYNTPTLYRLAGGDNTIVFNQFYGRNRTNISEQISLLGFTSKNYMLTTPVNHGYNFRYSLPNLFKTSVEGDDVTTSFFHANDKGFYGRINTHGTNGVGFDNLHFADSYTGEQEFGGFYKWISDKEFVSNQIDEFLPTNQRFLTYFASITTHGPYDYEQKYLTDCYQEYYDNFDKFKAWFQENTDFIFPEDEETLELFRHYKSAMIDLDRTVEYILNQIDERGLTDNTSVLLFADHNSYYSNLAYRLKGVDKTDFSNTYANNIPMLFYSPKLFKLHGDNFESVENTYCNTYDILPTICDLYGMASNKNLFQGYSVFSNEIKKSLFVSNLGGIFTKDLFSFNISDIYIVGDNVSELEIEKFKENANTYWKKQEYIEIILNKGINGKI